MTIILTGMHRSGTSMFARFMHESGIRMGEDFYRDETSNKYGHYEDLDFLNLQRRELARHFDGEDYLVYEDFPISLDFVRSSKELYRQKADGKRGNPWGWKDPRTSVFLHHWHAIDREAAFIFLVRKPEDVVNSLCRLLKTKWSLRQKSRYLKTYIYYNRHIITFLEKHQQKNMAVVSFEDLISNPVVSLEKISNRTEFNFNSKLFKKFFDSRIISEPQGVGFRFIQNLLIEATATYRELSKYF